MASIMTAHIAHSSATCRPSQTGVIIQALAPVIDPYMSRAITTVHSQQTSTTTVSGTTTAGRVEPRPHSRNVGGRFAGGVLRATCRALRQLARPAQDSAGRSAGGA